MELKDKALVVIEFISLHHDEIPEMGNIYMASHVANGTCQNPHENWRRWLEDFYNGLIATGDYHPK